MKLKLLDMQTNVNETREKDDWNVSLSEIESTYKKCLREE